MNADFLTLRAQFARNEIGSLMGEFLGHCRAAWQSWLSTDPGKVDTVRSKSRVCVIAELTTFEDIEFSAGMTQLLGIDWLDCDISFTLPTRSAVAFFQRRARQESFHQLVRALPVAELASALESEGDDAIVCVVPFFSLLTTKYLDALHDVVARRANSRSDRSGAGVFRLGSWRQTSDFLEKRRAPADPDQSLSFSTLPLCIAEASRRLERSLLEILDHFQEAAARPAATADEKPNELSVGALTYLNRGSELVLPVRSFDGDAWLQSAPSDGPSRLYARRRLQGADFTQPIAVEPPLALVGERSADAELVLRSRSVIRRVPLSIHVAASRIEPWMVTCYLNRGGDGNAMIRALAQGIGCGLRYAEDETGPRPGVPVVWGVLRGSDRVVAYANQSGQYFFRVDHAYFSRGHGQNYRVTRNAHEAGPVRECPTDRIQAHGVVLEPWQRGGSNVLVCPPADYLVAAHGYGDWLDRTLEALQRHTDRPIVVRRKPQPGETGEPLAEALSKAHALVTHSSNVAIEAVVAGVPVFVSPSSAAAPMGLTDLSSIETPVYPDRDKWLAHLAYCQFSLEEMRSGAAWRMLLEWEDRPFVDEPMRDMT
ncbi:MAG TPA: hypothetical protein VJN18_24305 [Polyangiaceae bacterium]|nr:hypothetical protein [Polyangiaceae bacterium]